MCRPVTDTCPLVGQPILTRLIFGQLKATNPFIGQPIVTPQYLGQLTTTNALISQAIVTHLYFSQLTTTNTFIGQPIVTLLCVQQTWKMSEILPEQDCSFQEFTRKCVNYVILKIATKQRNLSANTIFTT